MKDKDVRKGRSKTTKKMAELRKVEGHPQQLHPTVPLFASFCLENWAAEGASPSLFRNTVLCAITSATACLPWGMLPLLSQTTVLSDPGTEFN